MIPPYSAEQHPEYLTDVPQVVDKSLVHLFHEYLPLTPVFPSAGIPVDLIQLVDDCVEIPQQGIIRSLNVHVSGAIIIWEYFKQTLAKNNK